MGLVIPRMKGSSEALKPRNTASSSPSESEAKPVAAHVVSTHPLRHGRPDWLRVNPRHHQDTTN